VSAASQRALSLARAVNVVVMRPRHRTSVRHIEITRPQSPSVAPIILHSEAAFKWLHADEPEISVSLLGGGRRVEGRLARRSRAATVLGVVPLPEPMLARSRPLPTGPGWRFEPKLEGFNCLACTHSGRVRIRSRRGRDMTAQLPKLAAALPPNVQLDGEPIAWGEDDNPDLHRLGRRMLHGDHSIPVTKHGVRRARPRRQAHTAAAVRRAARAARGARRGGPPARQGVGRDRRLVLSPDPPMGGLPLGDLSG